jgi:hypothetical protein
MANCYTESQLGLFRDRWQREYRAAESGTITSQTGFTAGYGGASDDQRTHLFGMTPLVQQKDGSYMIAMLQPCLG